MMVVGEESVAARRTRRASANTATAAAAASTPVKQSRPALQTKDGNLHAPVPSIDVDGHHSQAQETARSSIILRSSRRYSLRHRDELSEESPSTLDSANRDDARSKFHFQVDSAQKKAPSRPPKQSLQDSTEESSQCDRADDNKPEPQLPLVHLFNRPAPAGHVAISEHSQDSIMSRPRAGRGGTGRDTRDSDMETDLMNRVIEAVKKAKEFSDNSYRLGGQIIELETEIKAKGFSTPEQHRKLDTLYREMMRNAEQEKRVHDDEDIVNNLAIIASLKTTDEPSTRGGPVPKSRKADRDRRILESDVIADSPGPSPSDSRVDILKRGKGTAQRSSSVVSQGRSGTVLKEDAPETNRGIQAEKAGQLIVGAEVFYRFPKGSPDDLGVGIQCVIKKVWQDKKPTVYDVQDPEPDPSGKQNVHRAQAKDLIPIPPSGTSLPSFAIGANVYARYPDTDTFYRAKVRGLQKGEYTLRFEGEEDDKEQPVEKRFVLDTKMR